MPVEIRELVIRTIITEKDDDNDDSASGSLLHQPSDQTDAIVQECVRQVLMILRKERER